MWKISILSSLFVLPKVYGHGYLSSPRSRNWVAHQDGTDSWSGSGSPGTPPREYCYHCLNSKAANEICGVGNANNYDEWLDLSGNPIPWNSQETYTEGDIITVKSTLTTNHAGHMDLFICPDGEASTQACLEANPVEYVDAVHHAPRDTKYPYRGYYSNNDYDFEMRYKLPMGVTGDKVMMQWRYVTGNSCMPPGYCCHNDDDYFEIYSNVSSWKRANTALCDYPLDPTGATGTGKPEQFWNCAEITILPGNNQPTTPSPTVSPVSQPTTTAPISSPTTPSPPSSNTPCCTIDFKNCSPTVTGWCSESQENCEGPCDKWWLPNGAVNGCNARFDSCVTDSDCCSPGFCDGTGTCLAPAPSSPTTPNPTTSTPNTTPNPTPTSQPPTSYSCTENYISSYDLLSYMDELSYQVSSSPYTLSILAEGGAAGSGGSVVSEGQGYGILTSAIALASLEVSDSNRNSVIDTFYGYFNGWKRMCINSSPAPCQIPQYCTYESGTAPCLPGWKHTGDLTSVIGTGAAPDGDVDAILGMIIAIKALEKGGSLPSWYDELRQWTDESCTQFLMDNTDLSSSKSHRIVKLGSCWGGWESDGNNPSYHAPGAYRALRDYHKSYDGVRNYVMPNFGDNLSLEDKWNMLIDTSYKFFDTTQCADTGLVPNWALVREVDSQSLAKQSGSFSGSGTPQYEFGAEASRTVWRVAIDAILYPEEANVQAGNFLEPLHSKLVDNFDFNYNDWQDDTLQTCSFVSSVFGSWRFNGFIFGPVYSTLAVEATSMTTNTQQDLVNAACQYVGNIASSGTYYSKSWQVISMMTLNGDMAKVGVLLGSTQPTAPPVPTPTYNPTLRGPTSSPTIRPTMSPTVSSCCSFNYKFCGSDTFCNSSTQNCDQCNGLWIEDSPKSCVALWVECGGSSDECCGPAHCVDTSGDGSYQQCQPAPTPTSSPTIPAPTTSPTTSPPTPVPSPTKVPTRSPTKTPTRSPVSSPTNSPTAAPIQTPPTVAPAGNPAPQYCCSWGGNECGESQYCDASQDNCEGSCGGSWINPNAPTPAPSGCCSWNQVSCEQLDNTWCQQESNCVGGCNGYWLNV